VYSDSTRRRLADIQEPSYNVVTRRAAVNKEEFIVLKAGLGEPACVVNSFIESYNGRDVFLPKIWEVRLGGMERIVCGIK